MRLERFCTVYARYLDSHFPNPYADGGGMGWGVGEGTVAGNLLTGTLKWSNHPNIRSDGVALPGFRGVITTTDGRKVLLSFTGRTVFVDRDGVQVGRLLAMGLFESEDDGYTWLNNEVCVGEGVLEPDNPRIDFYLCKNDLV